MARNLQTCQTQLNEKKSISGLSKNRSSTVQESREVSVSSIRKMKSSRKPYKEHGQTWKFRWKQSCLARSGEESTGRLVALQAFARQKYACIVEGDESTRQRLEGILHKDHEDHIDGKEINSSSHYNLVHKFIPMSQATKIQNATAAVDKEWDKLEKIPAWQLTKVRNKKGGDR